MGDEVQDLGLNGSLARVPLAQRRALVRAATAATVLLFLAITVLGLPLRTGAAPLGMVSLQFATSPEAAERMLASWAVVPRQRLFWAHGLDLLLPIAYAAAIVLAAARAAQAASTAARSAAVASGAAVAAAAADQVENLAMGVTIVLGPAWESVLVTIAAATAKSVLLALALGALVVASTARDTRVETG